MADSRIKAFSDDSMLANAQTQEEFVLAALETYECQLTRYATRLLGGDLDAARDVVQHTFMKLCEQHRDKLEQKLAPWLYTVCRNRSFDLLRKRGNEPVGDPDFGDHLFGREIDPAESMATNDLVSAIGRLIDALPPVEREIADLWSRGFSNQQMAQITAKSHGAVRVTLHRAIQKLKSHPHIEKWLAEETNVAQGTVNENWSTVTRTANP